MQQPEPSLGKDVRDSSHRVSHLKREFICDRCGTVMLEHLCKVTCPNCGNRFDCSDLNIYFDELGPERNGEA